MPEHRRGEPTCTTCGSAHSRLFGQPDDHAWCADCPWTADGITARVWSLHHAAATGHAAGLAA